MTWPIFEIVFGLIVVGYLLCESKIIRLILPIFSSSPTLIPAEVEPDDEAQILIIPTTDGFNLSACLYSRPESESRGLVIYCPEYGSTKWSWRIYCSSLWAAGFDILSFDFRNQGDSDHDDSYKVLHWLTEFEILDVKSVIQYVKSHPELRERPIGLFGVSRGGAAALAAGAETSEVELIMADSAFPTGPMMLFFLDRWVKVYAPLWLYNLAPRWHTRFTLKIVKWISQRSHGCKYAEVIPRLNRMPAHKKVFLVAGGRDSFVDMQLTHEIENSLGEKCEDLWVVENAKHNMASQLVPEEYQDRMHSFFAAMSPIHQPVRETAEQQMV